MGRVYLHSGETEEQRKKRLYERRSCGECRACCTVMGIHDEPKAFALGVKPAGMPCEHLREASSTADLAGGGCSIYETRPETCRLFACVWRSGTDVLDESQRPDKIGLMLDTVVATDRQPPTGRFQFLRGDLVERSGWAIESGQRLAEALAERGHLVVVPTGEGDGVQLFGPSHLKERFKRWVMSGGQGGR